MAYCIGSLKGLMLALDLTDSVVRPVQGGCIIRAAFLDDIYQAYKRTPDLQNLMMDKEFATKLVNSEKAWRSVVTKVLRGPCFCTHTPSRISHASIAFSKMRSSVPHHRAGHQEMLVLEADHMCASCWHPAR